MTGANKLSCGQLVVKTILIGLLAVVAVLSGTILYSWASLLAVDVVHTRDARIVESRMRMRLDHVQAVEGYFVDAYGTHFCWIRFQLRDEDLNTFLSENGRSGAVLPVRTPGSTVHAYDRPGVQGHRPSGFQEWIAKDFVPLIEYKEDWHRVILGSQKVPGTTLGYGVGCPRSNR